MFYRFETEVPLRWVDVDSEGVVNNAVFMSLMEMGRFAYFRELGLLDDHRVPFVIAETTVRFQRPGRLGMRISVAVATTRLGSTSFDMRYEVRADDRALVDATAALVYVDAEMKPAPIPDGFRDTVTNFEQLDAD